MALTEGHRERRGLGRNYTNDARIESKSIASGDHSAQTAAHPDWDVHRVQVGDCAEKLQCVSADTTHQQGMEGGKSVPSALCCDLRGGLGRGLKIPPPLDELNAE